MEQYTTEILVLLILLVIGFGFYNSKKSRTQSPLLNDQDPLFNSFRLLVKEEVDKIKKDLGDDITNLKVSSEVTKTANEERAKQILEEQQKLMSSLIGSKTFGSFGELLLGSALKNVGLIEGQQYVHNQTIKADGKSLTVEFAIMHPSGKNLYIDVHWPKTQYENLLRVRSDSSFNDEEKMKLSKKIFKDILKDYADKCSEVKKKYQEHASSIPYSVVYVPSESLFIELASYVKDDNELYIAELLRKYKISLMGPGTMYAYLMSMMLGFNNVNVEKKYENFVNRLDKLKSSWARQIDYVENLINKIKQLSNAANAVEKSTDTFKNEIDKLQNEIDTIENSKKEND